MGGRSSMFSTETKCTLQDSYLMEYCSFHFQEQVKIRMVSCVNLKIKSQWANLGTCSWEVN
jgi:hypothetical protein